METELFEAAKRLICLRYPVGWGGAAAVATENGKILTSIAPVRKMTRFLFAWKWEPVWKLISLMSE